MTLNEWAFQQERIISGKGVMQVSRTLPIRAHRYYFNVFREPESNFVNGKWNPPRSEYAKVTVVGDGYVWDEFVLNYTKQVYTPLISNSEAYLNSYLQCHFEHIELLLTQIMQSPLINLPVPLPPSLEIQRVVAPVDYIRVKCRDQVAVQVLEYVLVNDFQCAGGDFEGSLLYIPDNQKPSQTFLACTQASDPYISPDDNGNTVVYPGDEDCPEGGGE